MKFKREMIIISLIICMLFAVSAVSAAESDVQAISAQNSTDDVVSTVNDDNLEMNNNGEILAETDDSFSALNKKINIDEATSNYINLEHNYTCEGTSDVIKGYDSNNNGIYINRDLTIDGHGYTIDAASKTRIFYIKNSALSITFKNINFINGYDSHGGAFYATCNNLNIINCTFENNTVYKNPGGALYVVPTYVNIMNSTFKQNGNSTKDGGAIFIHGQNNPTTKIERSIFLNNVAKRGSAVFVSNYGSHTIKNSIFLNNGQDSVYYGAGYSSANINNNWWGSTSENAQDYTNLGLSSIYPSSWLYLEINSNQGISEVSLNNLYKYNVGCSTYSDYDLPEVKINISSTNAQISTNNVTIDKTGKSSLTYNVPKNTGTLTASYNGVELTKKVKYFDAGNFYSLATLLKYVAQDGDTIELTGDYTYNPSTDSGCQNNVWIQKNIVIDGKGHNIDGKGQTSLLLVYNANVKLINITFLNGFCDYGGAIYGYDGGTNEWEIINCTFINNTATDYGGGAVYSELGLKNIINSTFINNTITGGTGSAIYCGHSSTIANSIFVGNSGSTIIDASDSVIANYNWFGNTDDDPSAPPNVGSTVTADNWYVLNMTLENENALAEVSLNNLYGGNQANYALPSISLNIKGSGVETNENKITLDNTGKATVEYTPTKKYSITASYNGVEITKNYVDYAYFINLKSKITDDTTGKINLTQDYVYNSQTDSILLNGIDFAKDMIIDGQGYIIDANGSSNIFSFNDTTNTCTET